MYIIGSEQTYEREPSRARESKALQRERERLLPYIVRHQLKRYYVSIPILYIYTHTYKHIKRRLPDENKEG